MINVSEQVFRVLEDIESLEYSNTSTVFLVISNSMNSFGPFDLEIYYFIHRTLIPRRKGLTRRRFAPKLEGTYALPYDFSLCKFD